MDLALEVSLYIDRFHNLDLFQQGWYALKVSCCWEGSQVSGVPSRVVQYEAELTSESLSTVWRINDVDHSFCTRPFRIKYSRQDVSLAVMVSFSLPVDSLEAIRQSSVLLKAELLFAPLDGFMFFNSLQRELPSVSQQSFRIPAKVLHGLHAYCPLHFDAYHMALVDLYVHTVVLRLPPSSSVDGNQDMEIEGLLTESKNLLDTQLAALSRKHEIESKGPLNLQLSSLWNLFLKLHREKRTGICKRLRLLWLEQKQNMCSPWVIHSRSYKNGSTRLDPVSLPCTQAEIHRKAIKLDGSVYLQDMQFFGAPCRQPIIFVEQEVFRNEAANREELSTRKMSLIIFVHGFQGHHLDLRLVRNHWLLADPEADFLMSEANEDGTTEEFGSMGHRLADEAAAFLKHKIGDGTRECKVSFVGHSIGNLIIRAALTEPSLQPYLKYLHTFLSISGPHLGYMYSSNSLFNSGLWILKKLRASQCMHQLTFTDAPTFEECYLFKLSQATTFQHFQHVLLVSSPQDRYVPYHSSRIETCNAATRDSSKRAAAYASMVQNCERQLSWTSPTAAERSLIRCDVNFEPQKSRTLSSLIGRTAHIDFLDTDVYIRFIIWSFPGCF